MNCAVIGSGGREHAIVASLTRSPLVERVLAIPGNPGTAREPRTTNVAISATDSEAILAACRHDDVELVIIGPEAALIAGVADALRANGILVVGPGREGARLEGSKAFAKEIMAAAGVPTARGARVSSPEEVEAFVDSFDGRALVVKADGLAAGKGVVVCDSVGEARSVALDMLRNRPFGDACDQLVLEERLEGVETSFIVLTDGHSAAPLPFSQDHKRLLEGDEGPNTGGMGAYTPATFVTDDLAASLHETVVEPVLAELRRRNIPFRGFLYAGLMLTEDGPKVLEFNTRLGDPETQVLLEALTADPVPVFLAAARGELAGHGFGASRAAAVVVLAAAGYPNKPRGGDVISGLEDAARHEAVKVFHAGTRQEGGSVVTAGGRVLGVTATASTAEEALECAYVAAAEISWDGLQFRKDIGHQVRRTS